jgi:hypothetical protein
VIDGVFPWCCWAPRSETVILAGETVLDAADPIQIRIPAADHNPIRPLSCRSIAVNFAFCAVEILFKVLLSSSIPPHFITSASSVS